MPSKGIGAWLLILDQLNSFNSASALSSHTDTVVFGIDSKEVEDERR
jgi:hypothetical protein